MKATGGTMQNKVVMITGASRGIGEAAARRFAAEGAKVVLLARSGDQIAEIAGDIGENALAIPCDVSRYWEMEQAVAATIATFGRVDVLIGNAGMIAPMAPLAEADPEAWGQVIDVNLKGIYHGIRAVVPQMLAQGGGTVISISSGAAHDPYDPWSAYCASKAGVYMLTRQLHLEYGAQGIRSLGLSPGTVATQMQRDIKASGLGRVAQLEWTDHIPPEWPARALVWMCGPQADDWLGQDVRLRDAAIRHALGLT